MKASCSLRENPVMHPSRLTEQMRRQPDVVSFPHIDHLIFRIQKAPPRENPSKVLIVKLAVSFLK